MPPLSIMIKPASSACNMRCRYCFYHSLADARETFGYGVMAESTARAVIDKALAFADGESVYFAFQGGEPLLAGKGFFRDFSAYLKEKNVKNSPIVLGLQTNGTLIDEEWAAFFAQEGYLVGLSLDGDRDANRYRTDADGNYTFPRVMEAARLLRAHGAAFNILTVATGWTARHIEQIYRFFKEQGFRYLQLIPCLRPFDERGESELWMTERQYGDYLIRLFNLYVKDYAAGDYTSVRQLDNMVHLFLGNPTEQCGVCGHCSHQFVVEANGNVYPCDFYCLDEWLLGNIADTDFRALAHTPRAIEFLRESLAVPDKCRRCPYYRVCRAGGCKRSRADRDYCDAYRRFFDACLPLFRVFAGEKQPRGSAR